MTWLVESPWPALVVGVVLEAILAIALVRTGLMKIVGAMVAVLIVTLLLVVLERVVVTEYEEVEAALDEASAAIEANDVERVVSFIAPQEPQLKQYAERTMRQFAFSEVRVGNDLKVQVNPLTSPRSAKANFSVKVSGKDRKSALVGTQLVPVELTLQKIDGRWFVAEYQARR
jgi:hypothetical protein